MLTALHFPNGGCALADLNGDGRDDLISGGSSGLLAYLAQPDGSFVADPNVFPDLPGTFGWTTAPLDADGDGDLDLYVGSGITGVVCDQIQCSYTGKDFGCDALALKPGPQPKVDRLLLQTSPGSFTDATASWTVPPATFLSNVAAHDLDGDGEAEVLIGNDFGPAYLLQRAAGGVGFVDVTPSTFPAYAHAMGWGVGDLDGNGQVDLVLADAGPPVVLGRGGGGLDDGFFDLPGGHPLTGLAWTVSAWNPLLSDLDHDGHLDMALGVAMDFPLSSVGTIKYCSFDYTLMDAADLFAFGTDKPWTFTYERGPQEGCGNWAVLTQSLVDLDLDGDDDLVQTRPDCNGDGVLRVHLNNKAKAPAVRIRLVGTSGNRDAFGASVRAKVGGEPVLRTLDGITGVGSSAPRQLVFGLGGLPQGAPQAIEDVEVTWPGGATTSHGTLSAGVVHTISQP